jgi:hypothetical protein
VAVAQILDLLLCEAFEPVVALAELALAVLPLAVRDAGERKNKDGALAGQINRMTRFVAGRVFGNICPIPESAKHFYFYER